MYFILGLSFVLISVIHFLVSGILFWINHTLKKVGKQCGKTLASVASINHKKDVPIWSGSRHTALIYVSGFLKNQSKGVYEYTVDGNNFKIRYTTAKTARQMPAKIPVIYLKKHPNIARVDMVENFYDHWFYGVILFIMGVFLGGAGGVILLYLSL